MKTNNIFLLATIFLLHFTYYKILLGEFIAQDQSPASNIKL